MTHMPPPPPPPGFEPEKPSEPRKDRAKRSWGSRLLELALWAAVALATAAALVYASDRWLPSNF